MKALLREDCPVFSIPLATQDALCVLAILLRQTLHAQHAIVMNNVSADSEEKGSS